MGSGGVSPLLLTSVLDGGEWLASRFSRYVSGKELPVRTVVTRADFNAVGKRNVSGLCGE
jgi:hypothetical protein